MNVKRTATLVLVGVPAAAWLYAAATSGVRREIPVAAERSTAVDATSAALATEIARLHERLRPDAAPAQPGRNLFAFTGPRPKLAEAPTSRPALSEAVALPVAAPPPFKLIGLAENAGPEGPVRTAIISAPGQLFLVRQGDTIAQHYRIDKISADVVEIADLGGGAPVRLALK